MTKHYCDRCEREVETSWNRILRVPDTLGPRRGLQGATKDYYALCDECLDALEVWIHEFDPDA